MRLKNQAVTPSFLFLLSFFLIPSGANAAPAVSFETFDANRDGIISQDEWMNNARGEHQSLDRNRDGNVSYNEFHGSRGLGNRYGNERGYEESKRRQPRFEDLDANHDGVLSKGEWPGDATELFVALDANGDSNVSYNEFFNHKQISATVLKGLDTNNDNRISRGEWTGEAAEFNGVDANKDNFLTVAEISTASTAAAQSTPSASSKGTSIEEIFLKMLQK